MENIAALLAEKRAELFQETAKRRELSRISCVPETVQGHF